MTTIQILTIFFLSWSSLGFGQSSIKPIFFTKPYTDSTETNLYINTIIKFDYKTQYQNVKSADINKEVENEIRNKDYRVIALSGYSYIFPGLEGRDKINPDGSKASIGLRPLFEPHINKFGFKVITGTSDTLYPGELQLQNVAYDFGKEYNRLLFVKIGITKK